MSAWDLVAPVYVSLRSLVAIGLLVREAHGRTGAALVAQALSDVAAAVFVMGYARQDVRALLGWLAVPLFVYFIGWEVSAAARRYEAIGDSPGTPASDAELLGGSLRWMWDVWGVAPAFLAGTAVALNTLIPGTPQLPGTPRLLRCDPTTVAIGDTLTLRMVVPHGAELGVIAPGGRGFFALVAPVPARPGSTPEGGGFETQTEMRIATASKVGRRAHSGPLERVFTDTGSYEFLLSAYKDPSIVLTCKVRLTPPHLDARSGDGY